MPFVSENDQSNQKPDPAKIHKDYVEALRAFTASLAGAINTSGQAINVDAGERRFWGSVLLTRMVTIGTSLLSLCPGSVMAETLNWDFASVASLIRNLHECSLMFFYLAVEAISDDEWRPRLNVMQLHDHTERIKMLKDFGGSKVDATEVDMVKADLYNKLTTNPFFMNLESYRQKALLKGAEATIISNKEISQRMGDNDQWIWALYRFYSCHTHSTPLSYYRSAEQKRDGTENDVEKSYMSVALNFGMQVLRRADSDYQEVLRTL